MAAPAQGQEPLRVASGLLRRSAGGGRRGCKTGSTPPVLVGKVRRLIAAFVGHALIESLDVILGALA